MQVDVHVKLSEAKTGVIIHDGRVRVEIAETASPYDVVQTILTAAKSSAEGFVGTEPVAAAAN